MPIVNRRSTEQVLFSHDEWQQRDIDLLLDYFDARIGATDAAARATLKRDWRGYDITHEDDLRALHNYVSTTLSANTALTQEPFVRGVRDRRRSALRQKQYVLDLVEGVAIDTLSLAHWEGTHATDAPATQDELTPTITWNYGSGPDDFRNEAALYGVTSLRIGAPPNGAAYATGFVDPSAGPWTAEFYLGGNDGDNFMFFEVQRVLDTSAPDQTTAVVTMQCSFANDNIILTIRNTAGTELVSGVTVDTSHSPWVASPSIGWKHIAITQSANLFEIFFEGQRVYTNAVPGNDASIAAYGAISGSPDSKYIEETRLSQVVRYTGATYTVPTAPFTLN